MTTADLFDGVSPVPDDTLAGVARTGSDNLRFGIGEWYGQSFVDLTSEQRLDFAHYTPPAGAKLSSKDRARLSRLRGFGPPRRKEMPALLRLEARLEAEQAETKPCPFKEDSLGNIPCSKKNGVCSLRLYERTSDGHANPVQGNRSGLRATCPSRFQQDETAFKWASEQILKQPVPTIVREVGFLEATETLDGTEGADVGRIDMVVLDATKPKDYPLQWFALEIQAVYFSGPEMRKLLAQISQDVKSGGSGLVYPKDVRRPDYRSSGPKRLMPQLQIKVPTLRRWGKRMAVVVDRPFFESMGRMEVVPEISNCDLIWFVVDFDFDAARGLFTVRRHESHAMTLEEAVKGLTGGTPISQNKFESEIKSAI
jgi:hypothetical protein